MTELPAHFYLAATLAAMCVGLSKGGFPIIGMLAVPILALVVPPVMAAGLLLPFFNVTDIFGVIAYHRSFDRRNLAILIPAGIVGVGVGWATARLVPERYVTLLVGIIGIGFCLNYLLRHLETAAPRRADLPRGIGWGLITGFTSFVSHSGAPPYQMYVVPQKLDKMVFAGTSTLLFAVINAAKLLPYWALGQLSFANIKLLIWIFPMAIAATFVGFGLTKVMPQKLFYRIVMVALFVISLKLVHDGLLG